MLLPKRTKWRKTQKGRVAETTQRGTEIAFGTFALKSLESGKISNKQIEAARVAFTRFMKREGKVGFVFSLISQLPRSHWKYVWVKVKVTLRAGRLPSRQAVSFSKWMVLAAK